MLSYVRRSTPGWRGYRSPCSTSLRDFCDFSYDPSPRHVQNPLSSPVRARYMSHGTIFRPTVTFKLQASSVAPVLSAPPSTSSPHASSQLSHVTAHPRNVQKHASSTTPLPA